MNCFSEQTAATQLADQYETPPVRLRSGGSREKWNLLRNALPPEFSIHYSVKANPVQVILKYFLSRGAGLEIASGGEFHQAVRARLPTRRVVSSPACGEPEIEMVLRGEIGEIHAESPREARRIAGIACRLGRRAPIALRVNPSSEAGRSHAHGRPARPVRRRRRGLG